MLALASSAASAMFLPTGFPESVSSDYVAYQFHDTVQGLMSYLKGVLCTLSFLRGLGVGGDEVHDAEAFTALQWAMVVWITRDATGMLSGLTFGVPALTRTFSQRRWLRHFRMLAECLRGVAGCLDLAAATAADRGRFLSLVCASAVLNAFASVASTMTRASLITHFARADNIADCAAKESNQDRGVKLVGIVFAVAFLSTVGDKPGAAWAAYGVLTAAHLVFNLLAVRALDLSDGGVSDGGKKVM